jgi:hypothetical protein
MFRVFVLKYSVPHLPPREDQKSKKELEKAYTLMNSLAGV